MDELKASPVVNPRMAKLAELLRKGKEFANKVQIPDVVPLVGGQGAGDLLLGEAPEEIENWGYGNYPVKVPEMSNVPQISDKRKRGVADALLAAPFAGGSSGASHAMIAAGGDPRLILARGTSEDTLLHALKKQQRSLGNRHVEGQGLYNPSFAIGRNKLPDEFGEVFILPHPRALDPKTNPRNTLYNVDAFTGDAERHTDDTRLRFENPPDSDEYAVRIAASPRFNSFTHYETSPYGAASLGNLNPDTGMISGATNQKSFDRIIRQLDKSRPNWRDDLADPFSEPELFNPYLLESIRNRAPVTFKKLAPDISKIRKAAGVGQAHTELKVQGYLPMSDSNIQHVLYPSETSQFFGRHDIGRIDQIKQLKEALHKRGIESSPYRDLEEAVNMARDIQKSAKFASKLRDNPKNFDADHYEEFLKNR